MKRKGTRLLLWVCTGLLFFGLIACEAIYNGASTDSATTRTDSTETAETVDSAVSAEEQMLDEEVFPKDKVVDVKITIDEDDFQDMLDNASAEEFKTASVDYNGQHFDNIGIRTKGNLSLRSVVEMDDSDRYSFKLSFDEYVNQTLDGIQKINLNNNYSDASYMREFLTYELAEQMGLPTPKNSFVNVYINGELWGFYLAVEQIGDAYLERHFGNAYGALYKGVMTGSGSDLTWLGDDLSAYTGLAQKSESTNGDILIDMLDELNNGTDYEKYINVPDALGYFALNVLTNNMDSYIGGNKQNYYLYEDDGVFSILPWDYNMAFGGLGGGMGRPGGGGFGPEGADDAAAGGADTAEPGAAGKTDATAPGADAGAGEDAGVNGDAMAEANPGENAGAGANGQDTATPGGADANDNADAQNGAGTGSSSSQTNLLIDEPTQGALAERPLVAKLLAVEEYKTQYHEILQQVVDGYLANETFSARVAELSEMISSYVKADPSAFYTYEEYEQAVPQLITTNASQVENISLQLDGTIASSGDGSGSGGGMGGGPMGGGMQNGAGARDAAMGAQGDSAAADAAGAQDALAPQAQAPGDAAQQAQAPQGGAAQDGAADQAAAGGDAAGGQGQGGPMMGGERGQGQGGGFPGGGPMGGGPGGFGQEAQTAAGSGKEAILTAVSLVVLMLVAGFIAFYRKKRL